MYFLTQYTDLFFAADGSSSPSPEAKTPAEQWLQANPLFALLIFVVVFAIVGLVIYAIQRKNTTTAISDDNFRHLVAQSVLFSAIWGLVALSIVSVIFSSATYVLNILLPVFGTWVGTLLAFYFGKDNFETGAKNSERLVRALTSNEKLRSIPVTSVMISRPAFKIPQSVDGKPMNDLANVLLQTVRGELEALQVQRLPILDPTSGNAIAIIHKSLIDSYLVKHQASFATASLKILLDDAEAGRQAKNTFATVPNNANLADADEATKRQTQVAGLTCEDVFIVSPGSSRVEGWITSDIILSNSQV